MSKAESILVQPAAKVDGREFIVSKRLSTEILALGTLEEYGKNDDWGLAGKLILKLMHIGGVAGVKLEDRAALVVVHDPGDWDAIQPTVIEILGEFLDDEEESGGEVADEYSRRERCYSCRFEEPVGTASMKDCTCETGEATSEMQQLADFGLHKVGSFSIDVQPDVNNPLIRYFHASIPVTSGVAEEIGVSNDENADLDDLSRLGNELYEELGVQWMKLAGYTAVIKIFDGESWDEVQPNLLESFRDHLGESSTSSGTTPPDEGPDLAQYEDYTQRCGNLPGKVMVHSVRHADDEIAMGPSMEPSVFRNFLQKNLKKLRELVVVDDPTHGKHFEEPNFVANHNAVEPAVAAISVDACFPAAVRSDRCFNCYGKNLLPNRELHLGISLITCSECQTEHRADSSMLSVFMDYTAPYKP